MAEGDEKSQVSQHTSGDSSSQVLLNPLRREEEDKRIQMFSSSANYFHILCHREIGLKMTGDFPFIFRDNCHVQAIDNLDRPLDISDVVLAGELLLVFSNDCGNHSFIRDGDSGIFPYTRGDGEIKPALMELGRPEVIAYWKKIEYACYNSNNDSLITVSEEFDNQFREIRSIKISAIKALRFIKSKRLFPGESGITSWEFDISNCRGIIHNTNDKVFKIFELQKYQLLFTIRDEDRYGYLASDIGFLGPRNKEMVILYKKNPLAPNAEILLRIYSKEYEQLRKETWLPINPEHNIEFVVLCGTTGKVLLQQSEAPMKIIDISSDVPPIIKTTDIRAACCPYYLDQTKKFICCTRSNSLQVCDLEGNILVTFADHQLCQPNLFKNSYITNVESVLISLCSNGSPDLCAINASSIWTGNCLGKITAQAISDSEGNIKKSALKFIKGFVLDEKAHEFFTINRKRIGRWSEELCSDTYTKSLYTDAEEDG